MGVLRDEGSVLRCIHKVALPEHVKLGRKSYSRHLHLL